MSELIPVPRVRKSDSISSKKTMTARPLRTSPSPLRNYEPDLALGFADVLVQQLRALDVEEVAPDVLVAVALSDLFSARLLQRPLREGLAAPGGP